MSQNWGQLQLLDVGIEESVAQSAVSSGYYMRNWADFQGGTYEAVSDLMYGNKQGFSCIELGQFAQYLRNAESIQPAPSPVEIIVRTKDDILSALADARRHHYISEGSLTFRGQSREHYFERKIPNPFLRNPNGTELSIMPGSFRPKGEYDFAIDPVEGTSLRWFLHLLEPNSSSPYQDFAFSNDPMRVTQHYASSTSGLDLTFDIDVALFFATHRFNIGAGIATLDKVPPGTHEGVIYCLRFGSPSVTKPEFYIQTFDLFTTYQPKRILRQQCALPLIGPHERNIAVTEIDCIPRLHPDFDGESLHPEYVFPNSTEDAFYRKLLELKQRSPSHLNDVVEYAWARS